MYLTDLHVNQFGTLHQLLLDRLSDRITVYWGPNGCGKTTVVQFLRGLFYGLNRPGISYSNREHVEGGWGRFRFSSPLDGNQPGVFPAVVRRFSRFRQPGGVETFHSADVSAEVFSATLRSTERFDASDHYAAVSGTYQPRSQAAENGLPAWVTEDVFREVFTVSYEEADQFELLSRLCTSPDVGGSPVDSEIRAAEHALQQALRERDGDTVQSSIADRMMDLRRQQLALQHELQSLKHPPADLPERIRQLTLEIDGLTSAISRIDIRLQELDGEIARLESLIAEMRRRNVLPLDRPAMEQTIRQLAARLERWKSLRLTIARDCNLPDSGLVPDLQVSSSLVSLRALVSRLEDRVQELASRTAALNPAGNSSNARPAAVSLQTSDSDQHRNLSTIHSLQQEVAALCDYLERHEKAVTLHEESLEAALAQRSLSGILDMEQLLEQRIAAIRAEITRSEDILDDAYFARGDRSCQNVVHQRSGYSGLLSAGNLRTLQDVETELFRLRAERTRLVAERGSHEETLHTRRALLDRLRHELQSAVGLEQIDALRARIADFDARIVLLDDRRVQLDQTELSLREVIARLKTRLRPRVLELASEYVRRLTEGDCAEVVTSPVNPATLLVRTSHQAEPLTISQLSRGTRHQLALALRLALINIHAETSDRVPLVLDDVFITSDDSRAAAVVQLLSEVAAQGQQVIFLTCQKDVRDLFTRHHADVRVFGQSAAVVPAPVAVPVIEPPRVVPPVAVVPVVSPPVVVPPPAPIQPAAAVAPPQLTTNWLFYLEMDHGVDDLAGITLGELDAFRSAGIHTVHDLLEHSVADTESLIRGQGYLILPERLLALRGQAELTCRVPMLRRSDAALLYAAGIRSVEELRQLRPETVYDQIVAFQRTEAGSRYRRAGRLIDRQQAINWTRFSQHSRSLPDAVSSRSLFSVHRTSRLRPSAEQRNSVNRMQRRQRIREASQSIRRRPRIPVSPDAAKRRMQRLARRRRLAARHRTTSGYSENSLSAGNGHFREAVPELSQPVERPVSMATMGGKNLRFFLSRASDVESAPSIGPKTAESLYAIGVRTVDDLLQASSDRISRQLNHRRITPTVVNQWQIQARLMCQVPELRGHDVQILVACGIADPEDLARRQPHELLQAITPFINSREGERIIRSGRKPDLAEVSDWIQWAVSSRAFRAA